MSKDEPSRQKNADYYVERNALILKRHAEGMSIPLIAKRLGISYGACRDVIRHKSSGIPDRKGPRMNGPRSG